MKVYLAGPDVFRPDVLEWAETARETCRRYGYEALESARSAGLDRIKSGLTWRFARRLPIIGASRLPRSAKGRSLSGKATPSQLDLAWRIRNSVLFIEPSSTGTLCIFRSNSRHRATIHMD